MSTHSLTHPASFSRENSLLLWALGALALAGVVIAIVLSTSGSSSSTSIDRVTPSQAATFSRELSGQPGVVQSDSAQPGIVQNAAPAARTSQPPHDQAPLVSTAPFSIAGHLH